jgi:PD-(D/E)XK nuclease superfamily protein
MGRLVNELSWSRSRISMLRECKRQYYYQYYLKWEGWSHSAAPRRKLAYRLSKMSNLPMLCGNAVHEGIRLVLENLRSPHDVERLDDPALHVRKTLLSRPWVEAQKEMEKAEEQRWRNLKSLPPIFEVYYPDMTPDADTLKKLGAKAARCVENFLSSELYRDLKEDDPQRWLAVDEGPSFDDASKLKLDGRTLWALPDFARETEEGVCEIWDWKTGRPNPHDEMQLLAYAINARDKWGFPPEAIQLRGFYLADKLVKEYPCDTERLLEMEEGIRQDFREMESLLSDAENNEPGPEEQFPMIDDLDRCRKCLFRELCDR